MIKNQLAERIFPLIKLAESIGVSCKSFISLDTGVIIEFTSPKELGGYHLVINLCQYTDFDICRLESELHRAKCKFFNFKLTKTKKSILNKLTKQELEYVKTYTDTLP